MPVTNDQLEYLGLSDRKRNGAAGALVQVRQLAGRPQNAS